MGAGYGQFQLDLKSAMAIGKAIDKEEIKSADDFHQKLGSLINICGNDLHATLMYDKSNPDIYPGINKKTYKAKVTGVEKLGVPGKPFYALVLVLDCDDVQNRFKELTEMGFQHSFPDLKLHCSLHYGDGTELCYPFIKRLFEEGKLPEYVVLGSEQWNECK